MTIALLLSGTRASMLAVISIYVLNLIIWIYNLRLGKIFAIPFFLIATFSIGLLLNNLISEKDEKSNEIKFSYLDSYTDLISNNTSIILFGQGAGSKFYTKTNHGLSYQTEWSYIEMFRMFGLFGFLIIVTIFYYPLFIIYKNRKSLKDAFSIMLGYFLYLLVGGTNPLLIGSTGMLVLLVAYTYCYNTVNVNLGYKLNQID